ncbi:MAG: hypothetical protein ACJAXR_001316 [Halopseudomonas sp.]|jgi:hypothetical protein
MMFSVAVVQPIIEGAFYIRQEFSRLVTFLQLGYGFYTKTLTSITFAFFDTRLPESI